MEQGLGLTPERIAACLPVSEADGRRRGETLRQYSLRTERPRLLEEWDAAANLPLTPDTVSARSKRRVRWRCAKGHTWESTLDVRAAGAGCPYCAGKRPVAGENDLATLCPALAAEWSGKNGALRPEDFSPGSNKKVWWRCRHGHEWQAAIDHRSAGGQCPVCAGKKVIPGVNDLAALYPALAKEWSPKNSLKPSELRPGSNKKVWWRCRHGHEWQAAPNARVSEKTGCPYCANRVLLPGFNDLAAREPRLAAEWHPTLNGELTPDQVLAGSHRKVWWRCAEGHAWKAEIASRAGRKKPGCPVCAGNTGRQWRASHDRELAAAPANGA